MIGFSATCSNKTTAKLVYRQKKSSTQKNAGLVLPEGRSTVNNDVVMREHSI